MKPGDVVKIYQKPITQEDFEGWATLLNEHRSDEGDGLSMWSVEFLSDGYTCYRTIYSKEK